MSFIKKITYSTYNNEFLQGSVQINDSLKSSTFHNPSSHEDEPKLIRIWVVKGFIQGKETFSEETQENRVIAIAAMMEDKVMNELKRIAHPNPERSFAGGLRERGYSVIP